VTTDVLAKIPVDAITAQAREVRFWRTVLTVIAAVLFGLGWVTARVFAVAWLAASWSWVAVPGPFAGWGDDPAVVGRPGVGPEEPGRGPGAGRQRVAGVVGLVPVRPGAFGPL